jgi:hypothetical protein
LGKDEKEKLEEIIRLLRKLLSRNDYNPRIGYRASKHNLPIARGGSYKPKNYFPQHYKAYQGSGLKSETKRYETKERASVYSAKPWNEPIQYQPKERLVYDPEVKQILKNIEQKISSEPEVEEILRQLENNPELYEEFVERLSKDLEKLETNESDLGEEVEKEVKNEASEQNLKETEEPVNQEPSEELESSIETEQEHVGTETKVEEEVPEDLSEVEILTESTQEESGYQFEEPNSEVIEEIEAQDLSSLEVELYQESLEPIESIAPDVEPTEAMESMQLNEPLEQKAEDEVEDY